MAFFSGLLSISFLVWFISLKLKIGIFKNFWDAGRFAAFVMFLQVGVLHLVNPESFTYMIEGWLPYPGFFVLAAGLTEILFGFGLIWQKTCRWAGWLLIIQLVLMFPANINVAVNGLPGPGGLPSDPWYTWSRLLFQPVYIFWVYRSSIYALTEQKTANNSPENYLNVEPEGTTGRKLIKKTG